MGLNYTSAHSFFSFLVLLASRPFCSIESSGTGMIEMSEVQRRPVFSSSRTQQGDSSNWLHFPFFGCFLLCAFSPSLIVVSGGPPLLVSCLLSPTQPQMISIAVVNNVWFLSQFLVLIKGRAVRKRQVSFLWISLQHGMELQRGDCDQSVHKKKVQCGIDFSLHLCQFASNKGKWFKHDMFWCYS